MKKKYINATVEITSLGVDDVITASLMYIDDDNQSQTEDGMSFGDMFNIQVG